MGGGWGRAAQSMLGAENILGDWLEQHCQLMIFIGTDLKWGTQTPRLLFHVSSCPTSDSSPVILALLWRCFVRSWLVHVGISCHLLLIALLLYVQQRLEIIHGFFLLACCGREQTGKAPWDFSKQQLCYVSRVGDERVTTVEISLWLLVLTDVSASRRCSLPQTNLLLILIICIGKWQLWKVWLKKLAWLWKELLLMNFYSGPVWVLLTAGVAGVGWWG